jgi:hypothetical protein
MMSACKSGTFLVVTNPKPAKDEKMLRTGILIPVPPGIKPTSRKMREYVGQFRGENSKVKTLTPNGHRAKPKRAPPR